MNLQNTTLATIGFEVEKTVDKQYCIEKYLDMFLTLPSEIAE